MSRYPMPRARLIHREQPKKFDWKNNPFFTAAATYMMVGLLNTRKGKLQICKLTMDDTPEPHESRKIF